MKNEDQIGSYVRQMTDDDAWYGDRDRFWK